MTPERELISFVRETWEMLENKVAEPILTKPKQAICSYVLYGQTVGQSHQTPYGPLSSVKFFDRAISLSRLN